MRFEAFKQTLADKLQKSVRAGTEALPKFVCVGLPSASSLFTSNKDENLLSIRVIGKASNGGFLILDLEQLPWSVFPQIRTCNNSYPLNCLSS